MGIILLVIVLFFAVIEALIGVNRGVVYSTIRIVFLGLGTLIAAILAKHVAISMLMNMAITKGANGSNLSEVASNLLGNAGLGYIAETIGVPAAAWTLSAVIPFVFSVLFILFKMLTLIIFIIAEKLLDKTQIKNLSKSFDVPSKMFGGVLGGLIGITSCAIVASPVSGLVKTIDDTGAANSVLHMMDVISNQQATAYLEESSVYQISSKLDDVAFHCLEAETVYAASEFVEPDAVEKLYDSMLMTPVTYVCRYTGAEAISYAIYENISDVSPADVGGENVATESYNFPELVSEIAGVAQKLDDAVSNSSMDEVSNKDKLLAAQELADYVLDTSILADEDKLAILNASSDKISESLGKMMGMDSELSILAKYDSFDELKSEIEGIFAVMHIVVDIESASDGSLQIDVEKLLADKALLASYIDSLMKLSNGSEMICDFINKMTLELTGGQINNIVSKNSIQAVSADDIAETVMRLAELSEYAGKESLSEEDVEQLQEKLLSLKNNRVLQPNVCENVEKWLGLK